MPNDPHPATLEDRVSSRPRSMGDRAQVRRQDWGVLFFYYLGYFRIRNWILRLGPNPVARIVLFHDIPPEMERRFDSHLRFLKRHTNVIGLPDFFSGRLSSKRINVAITFDDGYASWVSRAIPILRRLDLPAAFFVSSGFVGRSEEDKFVCGRPWPAAGLSTADVRGIAEKGFVVGGHTLTHANLARLTDRSLVRSEIVEDKNRLEEITGRRVDYFAYPYGGSHNEKIDLPELLRESGYSGALTTISGPNDCATAPFLLKREITDVSLAKPVFRARALGNYDAVRFIKTLPLRIFRGR